MWIAVLLGLLEVLVVAPYTVDDDGECLKKLNMLSIIQDVALVRCDRRCENGGVGNGKFMSGAGVVLVIRDA